MIDKVTYERWVNEYINDVDLNKKEYLLLNKDEMIDFIKDNYYDDITKRFVTGYSDISLIGLQYIDYSILYYEYDRINDYLRFLLCTVPNNKGTKTVISAIRYYDEFNIYKNQKEPLTYLEYVETSTFFRNKGLYKEIVKELVKYIDKNRKVLTTAESIIGHRCNTYNLLYETLRENNFTNDIRSERDLTKEYKLMLTK